MNRDSLAYHEAGHAIALALLGMEIKEVSIKENEELLGFAESQGILRPLTLQGLQESTALFFLGGPVAENLFEKRTGFPWEREKPDFEKIDYILIHIFCIYKFTF